MAWLREVYPLHEKRSMQLNDLDTYPQRLYFPFRRFEVFRSPRMICFLSSIDASGCTATMWIRPKCRVTSACMLGPGIWAHTYPLRCASDASCRFFLSTRSQRPHRDRKMPALIHRRESHFPHRERLYHDWRGRPNIHRAISRNRLACALIARLPLGR